MNLRRCLVRWSISVCLLFIGEVLLGTSGAAKEDVTAYLGPAEATLYASEREGCGTLLLTSGGQYEAAFGWQFDGVQPPYYGAFAECYSGHWAVCAIVLDLTRTGNEPPGALLDAYVWADAGGQPGEVLCFVTGVDPGPVALWPEISRHNAVLSHECCVDNDWWVGYWPDWPGEDLRWYTTAAVSSPPGCPLTNIAPGIGYPTGWQDVELVWGPHSSLGIGAEVIPCLPTPAGRTTWGEIKSLYK